jgi:hypothetical protein
MIGGMPTEVTLAPRKLGLLVDDDLYSALDDGAVEAAGSFVPHSSQYCDPSRFPVPQDWHLIILYNTFRLNSTLCPR